MTRSLILPQEDEKETNVLRESFALAHEGRRTGALVSLPLLVGFS